MEGMERYAQVFKALSDPVRLRLLGMLPDGSQRRAFCVGELARRLGISQPCLSHHLNVLRTAGLVDFEKDGCTVYYYVDAERLRSELDSFREALSRR